MNGFELVPLQVQNQKIKFDGKAKHIYQRNLREKGLSRGRVIMEPSVSGTASTTGVRCLTSQVIPLVISPLNLWVLCKSPLSSKSISLRLSFLTLQLFPLLFTYSALDFRRFEIASFSLALHCALWYLMRTNSQGRRHLQEKRRATLLLCQRVDL